MIKLRDVTIPVRDHFPIFWMPILCPLLLYVIGAVIEMRGAPLPADRTAFEAGTAAFTRNANLSFISTDVWVLAIVLTYSTRAGLTTLQQTSLGTACVIGLLVHFLFYILIPVVAPLSPLIWPFVIFGIGLVGVILIRATSYNWIELKEMGA